MNSTIYIHSDIYKYSNIYIYVNGLMYKSKITIVTMVTTHLGNNNNYLTVHTHSRDNTI